MKKALSNLSRQVNWQRFAPLLALVVLLCLATTVSACPTCKEGLAENDPAYSGMVSGYFYSILFMMLMPYVIIGTLGGLAYLSVRRAREAKALAAKTGRTTTA